MAYIKNTVEITDAEHQELKDERRDQLNEQHELGEFLSNLSEETMIRIMKLYDEGNALDIGTLIYNEIKNDIDTHRVES